MRQGLAQLINSISAVGRSWVSGYCSMALLVARMKVKDGRVLMTFTYLLTCYDHASSL